MTTFYALFDLFSACVLNDIVLRFDLLWDRIDFAAYVSTCGLPKGFPC